MKQKKIKRKKCSCGRVYRYEDPMSLPKLLGDNELGIMFNCEDCDSTMLVPFLDRRRYDKLPIMLSKKEKKEFLDLFYQEVDGEVDDEELL